MDLPVLADLPFSLEDSTSHWNVVLAIGAAYFALQLALSFRVFFTARQQARILTKLCRDFERGGDGRTRFRAIPKHFSWLRWVLTAFPAKSLASAGNFTRDDVLGELDTRLAGSSAYLLLQRLGVVAPLLGVILTVIGFFWLDVRASDDQSLQGILLSVTPLVIGVGAGAALAMVNQALLHFVGGRIEAVRIAARNWFDTVIWNHVGLDSQAATSKAIAAVDRFTRALVAAADRHAATTERIEQSTALLQSAASQLQVGLEAFYAEIKHIPQALNEVHSAAAAGAAALEELIPVGTRAVANLDVSVAAFRTTIDREFAGAAQRHDSASRVLVESTQQIRATTSLLHSGSNELKLAAEANSSAQRNMDQSVHQHLVPGSERFHEAIDQLSRQVAEWGTLVTALSANVEAMTGELNQLGGGVLPSVNAACDVLDERIGRAVAEQARQAESIGGSAEAMRQAAERLADATATMNDSLCESLADLRDAVCSLRERGATERDIDRLHAAATRAAQSADTVSALSERIRDMVEQHSERDGELVKSRGSLRSWLSGRPR